jgi:enterochelin esterase-like enzyme
VVLSHLWRVICALAVAASTGFSFGASAAGEPTAVHGTVKVLHVASADDDVPVRDVWVYTPAVAHPERLPVVYFLHGIPGSPHDFFDAGGASKLDDLFAAGAPPFVLAAPTGTGNAHPDTEWADSVDGRDRLETYLIDDVIPAVEGRDRRDAAHRVVAGFSMGGYGAANIALQHPELFGGAAAFAGYFHIDDPDGVFDNDVAVERANDPSNLIRTNHDVRFMLADGDSDQEPVVQGELQRFAHLAAPAIAASDIIQAPGSHDWSFVVNHLDDLSEFVDRVSTSA